MQNEEIHSKRLRSDPWEEGGLSYHSPLGLGLAIYAFEFFRPGSWVEYAIWFWTIGYLINFPLEIWHVHVRPKGGDPRHAAIVLALGAIPYLLFIPLWSELTTHRALMVMFPVIALVGVVAMWLGWRREGIPKDASPQERRDPPASA